MPAVSVIVTVYNVEKYLRECLDSLVAQTLTDFEAICVNDGSTDGSLAILEEYAAKDTRFKIISQENGGLSAARNTGMDMACAKYLYFLDSDDWIESDTLKICCDIADKNNLDELIFNRINFYENPDFEKKFHPNNEDTFPATAVMNGRELFTFLMQSNNFLSPVPFRLLRRQFIADNNLRFYNKLIHEDDLFSTQVALCSARSMSLSQKFYHQRRRENSIMTGKVSFQRILSCAIIHKELSSLLLSYIHTPTGQALLTYLGQNLYRASRYYLNSDIENTDKEYAKHPAIASFYSTLQLFLIQQEDAKELWQQLDAEKEKLDFLLHKSISYKVGKLILWLPQKIYSLLKGNKDA